MRAQRDESAQSQAQNNFTEKGIIVTPDAQWGKGRVRRLVPFAFAVAIAIVSFLPGIGVFAQTSQGITGTVADATGAVIANARVIVHNEATGVDKVAVTTGAGAYSAPFLTPGIYDVSAEAAGFQKFTKTKLTLVTDQTLAVNFALSPGAVTQ